MTRLLLFLTQRLLLLQTLPQQKTKNMLIRIDGKLDEGVTSKDIILVKKQAEEEGLDKILMDAGFDWREPGCSMCLAMNSDKLKPQERCASTSNRNFEGRQGNGGRTHLMSPAMAAAAAIAGGLVDVRKYPYLGDPSANPRNAPKESTSRVFSTETFKPPGAIISPIPPYQKNRDSKASGATAAGLPKFTTLTGVSAPLDNEEYKGTIEMLQYQTSAKRLHLYSSDRPDQGDTETITPKMN
jgi:hypothetical protein